MNNIKCSRRSFLRQNIAAGAGILPGSGLPLSSYAKTLNGGNQGEISFSLFDLDDMGGNNPIVRVVGLDIGENAYIITTSACDCKPRDQHSLKSEFRK